MDEPSQLDNLVIPRWMIYMDRWDIYLNKRRLAYIEKCKSSQVEAGTNGCWSNISPFPKQTNPFF